MERSAPFLIVSPPFRSAERSDLAVTTLKALCEAAGIATDTLYGSHLFPGTASDIVIREQYSHFFFVPHLYPDVTPETCVQTILDTLLEDSILEGARVSREEASLEWLGVNAEELRRGILEDIARAGVCLDRCLAQALAGDYRVVAFSCAFETQIPAALALARRLKAARPDVGIAFGGSACFDDPARELLKLSPAVDAVCYSEGDNVIVPLVRALMAGAERDQRMGEVLGVDWRDRAGELHHAPPAPRVEDMDELPIPYCDDFVASLAASEWACAPIIHFETSRGCWWGVKHLCSFCGLNADMLTYRKKSPERAFEEIRLLNQRYPDARQLFANDTILDMGFLGTLMPRLARMRAQVAKPPKLFWEIKANLRREQVRALADAGVELVQPGIESFSDEVLDLMHKGSTALSQIQHIKWLYQDGLDMTYSVLVLNPGERSSWYRDMAELVPFIDHLPPPRVVAPVWLERFSPNFNQAAEHGITNMRAKPYYRILYHGEGIDLERLAYVFDYDHAMFADEEHKAAIRDFLRVARVWMINWQPNRAYYLDDGADIVIVDQRGLWPRAERLVGLAARLFRYLDQIRPLQVLEDKFAEVPRDLLHALLHSWQKRRWVCVDKKGRYLAVLPTQPRRYATHDRVPRDRIQAGQIGPAMLDALSGAS